MKDYLTFVTLILICIVCFYIKKRKLIPTQDVNVAFTYQ